jgi:hypothetical protein
MTRLAEILVTSVFAFSLSGSITFVSEEADTRSPADRLENIGARVEYEDDDPDKAIISIEVLVNPLDEVSAKDFAVVGELSSLREARLTGAKIDDRYVEYLTGLKRLEELELVDTRITDKGLKALSQIKTLKRLVVAFSPLVTDAGVENLAKLANLEELVLTDVPGLKGLGLAALQGTTKLRTLDLSWTGVTDDGLTALKGHKSLQHLVLEECPISERSLQAVATMPKLRELSLEETKVSRAQVEQFRKARPTLLIRY